MKHLCKNVIVVCSIVFTSQICFYESIHAMAEVGELLLKDALEDVGLGGLEGATRDALGEAVSGSLTKEFGEWSSEAFSDLSKDVQDVFKRELRTALDEGLGKAVREGGISLDAFKGSFGDSLGTAAKDFSEKVNSFKYMDDITKNALEQFKIGGEPFKLATDIEIIPRNLSDLFGEVETGFDPGNLTHAQQVSVALDGVDVALNNIDRAPSLAEGFGDVSAAQSALDVSGNASVNAAASESVAAESAVSGAQDALDSVREKPASSGKEIEAKEDGVAKAKREAGLANEKETLSDRQATAAKLEAHEKFIKTAEGRIGEITKEVDALDKADPEYANKLKDLNAEKAEWKTELDKSKTNFNDLQKEYIAKTSFLDLSTKQKGEFFKEWFKAKGLEVGSLVGQAVVFMVPSIALEQIVKKESVVTLRDTIKAPVRFGTLDMQLPDGFLNQENPQASKFVYWGVTTDKDSNGNINLDKPAVPPTQADTANYYASYPEYGTVGEAAITDPMFPKMMIHLNTGLIFNGDGNAVEGMQVGILKANSTSKESLAGIIDFLSADMEKGIQVEEAEFYVFHKQTGYAGNKDIAAQFTKTKDTQSPLIARLLKVFEQGTAFGSMKIQEARGFGNALSALNITGAKDDAFVANGHYIYQTQDTPVIQQLFTSLAGDKNETLVRANLYDYIVCFDKNGKPVPLQTPQVTAGLAPGYSLNPDVAFVMSLLDPQNTLYDSDGKAYADQDWVTAAMTILSASGLQDQYNAVFSYALPILVNGPFHIGAQILTIDKTLADARIPVYKIAGFLEGGGDDYVVALKGVSTSAGTKAVAQLLPIIDQATTYFVSLVTSRYYDANLAPKTMPADQVDYSIVRSDSSGTIKIFPSALTTESIKTTLPGYSLLYSGGKAFLYTLFMDGSINPNKADVTLQKVLEDNGVSPSDRIPQVNQWALKTQQFLGRYLPYVNGQDISGSFASNEQFLQTNNQTLLDAINTSHVAWIAAVEKNSDQEWAKHGLLGPFTFVEGIGVNAITIWATGINDVLAGAYVYVSDYYRDEYLVLSDNSSGTSGLATAFDVGTPQQYLISLSNGNVYDRTSSGAIVGTIQVARLNKMDAVKSIKTNAPDLWSKIIETQKVADIQLQQNLYQWFGPKHLYITQDDYFNQQYIYADVTDLGNPIDKDGNEDTTLLGKVEHYYVAWNVMPNSDDNTIGLQISDDTNYIIDLTNMEVFGRDGTFQGSYSLFDTSIKTDQYGLIEDIGSTLGMIFDTIKLISAPNVSIRLESIIRSKANAWIANAKKERAQLQETFQAEAKDNPAISVVNLNAAKYLSEDPNDPRYAKNVKYADGGYWIVSPRVADANNPTTYLNLYRGKDKNGQPYGSVYDEKGNWLYNVTGWALASTLAFAGVVVDFDNGTQTLTLGVDQPSLPMTYDTDTQKGLAALQAVTGVPLDPLKCSEDESRNFALYYHKMLDGYFVKVSQVLKGKTLLDFYVDFISGFAYDKNGLPFMHSGPVFEDTDAHNYLFVVLDPADRDRSPYDNSQAAYTLIAKDAFDLTYHTFGQYGPDVYTIELPKEDDYGNKFQQGYKALLRHFVINPEPNETSDLSKKLDGYFVYADPQNIALPDPYWLLFSINSDTNDIKFAGKFTQSKTKQYVTLNYLQTRAVGSAVSSGVFDINDSYLQPFMLMYDGVTGAYTDLLYDRQVAPLTGSGSQYTAQVVDVDQATAHTITLKNEGKKNDLAHWISITDNQKVYDCQPDFYSIDPNRTYYSSFAGCKPMSLYYLKNTLWKVNVSNFVPNILTTQVNQDLLGKGNEYSASLIVKGFDGDNIAKKASVAGLTDTQATYNLKYIYVDSSTGPNRYLYKLGSNSQLQEMSKLKSGRSGLWVDLSNGVLFENGSPIGFALSASDLYLLLDLLRFSVTLDENKKPVLTYRSVVEDQGVIVQAVMPLYSGMAKPLPVPQNVSQAKKVNKPRRLKKPIKMTRAQLWKKPVASAQQATAQTPPVVAFDFSADVGIQAQPAKVQPAQTDSTQTMTTQQSAMTDFVQTTTMQESAMPLTNEAEANANADALQNAQPTPPSPTAIKSKRNKRAVRTEVAFAAQKNKRAMRPAHKMMS